VEATKTQFCVGGNGRILFAGLINKKISFCSLSDGDSEYPGPDEFQIRKKKDVFAMITH
jgi:hypothetical protein